MLWCVSTTQICDNNTRALNPFQDLIKNIHPSFVYKRDLKICCLGLLLVCQGSEKRFILRKLFSSSFQAMLVKQKERKKPQQSFKQTVVSRGEGRRREKVVVRKRCCGNCTKLAHYPSPCLWFSVQFLKNHHHHCSCTLAGN